MLQKPTTTPTTTTNLVRLGIWALPLSGLLVLVAVLGRYNTPNPGVDPILAVSLASSRGYFVSQFVGNVLGLTLLIFGVISLTAYLANTRVRGLAIGGMVLSIVGIALLLSALGVTTYALPAIARAYQSGQQDAPLIIESVFGSPLREMFVAVILCYSAGFILFSIAVWRSGVLPKRAALPLALQAPLLSFFIRPQPTWATVVGALLFVLGGTLIAFSVFRSPPRSPPAGEEEVEEEPSG
jgi:hypothetical protein